MKKHLIQQRSSDWFQLRKGKMTGTTLKAIMGTPKARQEAMYDIIAERLTVGVKDEENYENAMDRGTRLEPEAVAVFEFETGKKCESIGLCEDDDNSQIANSPDSYIADTDDTEALEIKCPEGKNYVKFWLTNEIPDDYEWQVVQYFVPNKKLKLLNFFMYNPDIPVHPFHLIVVKREDIAEKIEKARKSQIEFLKEVEEKLSKVITL